MQKKSEFNSKLKTLQKILKDRKIDYFILQNSDEFFSEYLPESEKRIEYLTGFNGSNAILLIGQNSCDFFTDGRYILQAKNQLDKNYSIFNLSEKSILARLSEIIQAKQTIALDGKLSKISLVESLENLVKRHQGKILLENLFDQKFCEEFNKKFQEKFAEVFLLEEKNVGENYSKKIKKIIKEFSSDSLLISDPSSVSWLLNLRANQIEFSPIFLAYAIILKNGEIKIFGKNNQVSNLIKSKLKKVEFFDHNQIEFQIKNLCKSKIKSIEIDQNSCNYWLFEILEKNNLKITKKTDPCLVAKACKNSAEVKGSINAHLLDGIAMTKFLFWLKNQKIEKLNEISAQKKLLEFRKENNDFIYPSFATISSFGSNGAIIHYNASKKTNKKFKENSLYLVDSGGQYCGKKAFGTTDVTRTVAIGKPSQEMVENFTRVLKGHISLARAKFPINTNGATLDVLARFNLWQKELDYSHGTGHGVGAFLSVHEGPQAISKYNFFPLLENMIISNEPGFYCEGKYGIRIENLMLVKKISEKFLSFQTLTLVPLDLNLIDIKMLTYPEKKWLWQYHQEIYHKLKNHLNVLEKKWLLEKIEILKS